MSSASYNRKSQDFTKIDNHASYSQDFYSQNGSVHHGNSFENYNTQKMTPNGGKTIILGDGATLTPKGGVTPGNGQEIRVLTVEKAGFRISDLQQPPKQIEKNDEGNRSRSRENSRKFVDENKLRDPLLGNGLESAKTTIIMAESSDPVSRQIDEFIRDLPQKKDWSHLKEILRKRLANVRPRNVKLFLLKLKTMLTDVDGVSTNIMEEKIDIFFFEKPFFSVMKEIATCESSILNFIRDVTWAPLTFFVVDMFLSPAQSCFISQTATQTILSMLTMALTAVVYRLVKNKFDPVDPSEAEPWHITLAKTIFVWLGAGLAIPGWNALQVVGENAGLWVGLSSNAAGFFSGMFPGIPEGPIQGIMSIISANTINRTWGEFNFLIFLKQVLIFGTFGAVPGDIWQFAYQAITDGIAAYGDMQAWAIVLVLGIGLATAVYIGNVGFGTFYERVINESHLIIELEVIEDSVDLTEDIIDKHHGHIVSYNGRAGAPNEEDIIIVKHDPHGNHFDHHGHHHDHLHEHHHHEQHLEQNHAEANEIHSYL